jgi:hypothetical protein
MSNVSPKTPVVVKPTQIKHGIAVGTVLKVDKGNPGAIGMQVHEHIAQHGHNMNPSDGCDMPDLKVEVKSRKRGSRSAHTIGTVSIDTVLNCEYEQTVLYEKSQHVYKVTHVPDTLKTNIVQDVRLWDFSIPECQHKLKQAYNIIRQKVRSGCRDKRITGNRFGNLERQASGSYQFRLTNKGMQDLEAISLQKKAYQTLFED